MEISKAAIAEIHRMQSVRQRFDCKFRIGFTPGGCEHFYYSVDLTDAIAADDRLLEVNGIAVVIDRQQLAHLERLKLDYSEDLMGGGFRFENPIATHVCGCGNSFAIANVESERWQLPT
ncbi:iron-sulfur cluster assembly accessory protein [Chamaesiphon sp. OTE_75_metabat_556]|uniref:HesB/IscA family protein n=1 Tax=Chamaesiphon sp. OTE_75_metabat_556 TaxID=2964692 RepID=UPI00286B79B8|nr:iron-sulfur cluster assembly accessory protein [Chamaesiphon sp. OTE_75_metabat_556]